MGVIQRQSIKSSIVSYTGVIIGFISTLFIYPLDWELYGSIQYWITSATILTPILRQGSTALINKFHPYFKKQGIKGFMGMILLITTATIISMSILLLLIGIIFQNSSFIQGLNIDQNNVLYVYVLAIIMIYATSFQYHAANMRRIVIPDIISKIGYKLINISIILLVYFNLMDESWSAPVLILLYLIAAFIMITYLKTLNKLDLFSFSYKNLDKKIRKSIFRYWMFGGLNYLGILLAYKIDLFMIGTFVNKTSVGYYSLFLYMSSLMIIPMASINAISGPIVSESFEHNDIENINDIYKKSSNNILVFGCIVLLLLWINISFLLEIMRNGEDLVPLISILLILGIAKIFDLMTSINNLIMIYSKWYHINLILLLIMSAINITLNIFLIDKYGIEGAAVATVISVFLFNLLKTGFIYIKLKIHPFSKSTFVILFFLACGILLASYFQNYLIINPFFSIVLYSALTVLIFVPLFYALKVSPELNGLLTNIIKRLKR